jgi:hypothetical protein
VFYLAIIPGLIASAWSCSSMNRDSSGRKTGEEIRLGHFPRHWKFSSSSLFGLAIRGNAFLILRADIDALQRPS